MKRRPDIRPVFSASERAEIRAHIQATGEFGPSAGDYVSWGGKWAFWPKNPLRLWHREPKGLDLRGRNLPVFVITPENAAHVFRTLKVKIQGV